MHPKITILGCGLSGMLTALAFAKHNIPTTIIELRSSKQKDFFKDVRTTALTSSSKKIFEEMGIWPEVEQIAGAFNDIYVADNKAPEMLHFASDDLEEGELMGHLVENSNFKKLLFELVINNKLITLLEESSYDIKENTEDGCKLVLNQKLEHECDLLIVCDGMNSKARQRYFSSATEKSYNQHAITFIVQHEKSHEGTAVEHFMPSGPFAILPLKDQHLSSVVWTIASEKKDAIMNLAKDELEYLVQQNFGDFLGKISITSQAAAFPLKLYETKQYYNKKVVLIADSAHIMHPLAGQGLNQGIKDIACLIALILEHGASKYALTQYQKARQVDNSNMLEITDTINALFSNKSKMLHGARQLGFKAIEEVPLFKKLLVKYAMGRR
ncbi:MAG: FAD-dependent monooxygenase [Rickettsiaceae bacterium]|nr:FAD-dependent monooxygenase [Rickettsiaceae bacterium]MDP4832178.1 FAD-dependent monooxygenase [Rickettsiaceae bacterium]MDP5020379.1 FAD-dependent monooxygenase [Rickettsiaceae bacterium]MDP5083344.1 FAD-dependent monooxygenase [Rickettsiaceae bacterium]